MGMLFSINEFMPPPPQDSDVSHAPSNSLETDFSTILALGKVRNRNLEKLFCKKEIKTREKFIITENAARVRVGVKVNIFTLIFCT